MDLSLEVSYALRVTASLSIDAPINTTHKTILMRNPYEETVARRRSAALLSEFGFGHVREYAPFSPGGALVPYGTLPSSSGLASHPSFKVSAHLRQMCENGTSCNILMKVLACKIKGPQPHHSD